MSRRPKQPRAQAYQRYKVHLVALTPERALVTHSKDMGNVEAKGIWIPAKRVMFFEGRYTHVDLNHAEAKELGYEPFS